MSQRGELKKLIKEAQRQGFRHKFLGSGHHRFYAPNGKDIVQCSSTVPDGGWWKKVLTEMRKAGFDDGPAKPKEKDMINGQHATTSLGDALLRAEQKVESEVPSPTREPPRNTKTGLTDFLRDLFRQHPDSIYSVTEVMAFLHAAKFDADYTIVSSTLPRLAVQGEIIRCGKGCYQWAKGKPKQPANPTTPSPAPQAPVRAELALPPVPAASVREPALAAPEEVDPDELELDEALAALGRIESVVRKHKAVIKQLAALKKLLNSGG